MKNSHLKALLLISSFLILSSATVLAFGISIPYTSTNPLIMPAGTTQHVYFNLQNCPSLSDSCPKEDENVRTTLLQGSNIAQIVNGNDYNIPYGTADVYIDMKVSIPQCNPKDAVYNIKFTVTPIDTNGNLLGIGYNVEFPVQVTENPDITVKCKKDRKPIRNFNVYPRSLQEINLRSYF